MIKHQHAPANGVNNNAQRLPNIGAHNVASIDRGARVLQRLTIVTLGNFQHQALKTSQALLLPISMGKNHASKAIVAKLAPASILRRSH
jgi:hypothetical protein